MPNLKRRAVTIILSVVLSGGAVGGCANNEEKAESSVTMKPFTRVFPVYSQADLEKGVISDTTNADHKWAMKECLGRDSAITNASAIGVAVSALAGAGIKVGLDLIDEKLKKSLEQYSLTTEASWGGALPAADNDKKLASYPCWRVTKGVLKFEESTTLIKHTEEVYFDAVIALVPDKNALGVRPIRLAYNKAGPKKKSSNSKYGIAVSLSISASRQQPNFFEFTEVADVIALKDEVTFTGENVLKYYNSSKSCRTDEPSDDGTFAQFETTPFFFCTKEQARKFISPLDDGSTVQIGAKISEVGAPSTFIKFVSDTFSGAKEDIGGLLADRAAQRIDPNYDDTQK